MNKCKCNKCNCRELTSFGICFSCVRGEHGVQLEIVVRTEAVC